MTAADDGDFYKRRTLALASAPIGFAAKLKLLSPYEVHIAYTRSGKNTCCALILLHTQLKSAVVDVIVAYGHHTPVEFSPTIPCVICEPERSYTAVTARSLCNEADCINPCDPSNVNGVCQFCWARKIRRILFGAPPRLLGTDLAKPPTKEQCAVYECGGAIYCHSVHGYPVCRKHADRSNIWQCDYEGYVEVVNDCDASRCIPESQRLVENKAFYRNFIDTDPEYWNNEVARCKQAEATAAKRMSLIDHLNKIDPPKEAVLPLPAEEVPAPAKSSAKRRRDRRKKAVGKLPEKHQHGTA